MCGIAGYLNLSPSKQEISEILLNKMQEVLQHRGPDGHGIWLSQDHQIGFAHRRLSIIDLSEAGKQPMISSDGSVVISYNGEIYNHAKIRAELEKKGYQYRSKTDTETILYAYQEWGIECLSKFEGMFAIALYDLNKRELYIVRDRIGIKPLYFSLQGNFLSFASEIKALWQLPWMKKDINRLGLYHYLTFLVTPAPMTLYEGIYKLPAGFYAKVDAQKEITFHEWYNPVAQPCEYDPKDFYNEEFCITHIRSLLRESISKRMMSDVPFGVFLSGGIDSSLNVALMKEFTDNVKTFNVSFSDGPEYSEVEWARKVAKHFGTDHHEIVISEKEAFDFFEKMVYHQDEPIADCVCVPLYYVSKLLKDSGVTVVQVGEGSDELFCGYTTYAQYLDLYHQYWRPTQKFIPAFARKGIYQLFAKRYSNDSYRLQLIKNWSEGKNLFWGGATAFTESSKEDLFLGKENRYDAILEKICSGFGNAFNSYEIVDYHLKQFKKYRQNAGFLESMTYLEFKQRLPELLLMRVDKMCMATSVEGRVPFLDHKLVEFAFHIPEKLKYHKGITKYVLKKACEGILPADVIYRKKMGFAAPTKRWFKEGTLFKDYFSDLISKPRGFWSDYLSHKEIEMMFNKTQGPTYDYSVQLWVLQNLMANDIAR